MREPSSSSVKVRWPKSKDAVLEIVKQFSRELQKTGKVQQIWLFGSYAKDDYSYGSDVDICIIVMDNSDIQYESLLEMFQEISEGIEVQFHIYEQTTFNSMIENGHVFPREIIKHGIQIF